MSDAVQSLAVAIATRQRPGMMARLLEDLLALQRPEHVRLVFIIVENEPQPILGDLIDHFRRQLPVSEGLIHVCEPRLGIPFARNQALAQALAQHCTWLAFLDDDVNPAKDWLQQLLQELQSRQLDLVGGPVQLHPLGAGATWRQRSVWRGLNYRFRRVEWRAAHLHRRKRDNQVSIITSNWLARLAFLHRNQLRFDESMGASGGSDTRFHRALLKAGGRSGWAPQALVSETWPTSRLTLAYLYKRGRDQAIAHYHNKFARRTAAVVISSLLFIGSKMVIAVVALPWGLLGSGVAATTCARSLGLGLGRWLGLCGRQSSHYKKSTGE